MYQKTRILFTLLTLLLFSGCNLLEDITVLGIWGGVAAVIIVVALILFYVLRTVKKKGRFAKKDKK